MNLTWDDFGNFDRFNPNISKCFLINGSENTGLGAERQCNLVDGKNYVQERVTDYVPGHRIAVDIFKCTFPFKRADSSIELTPLAPNRTELIFTLNFEPKMGYLGNLMAPLVKLQFRKLLGKIAEGNKVFVETGREALNTTP